MVQYRVWGIFRSLTTNGRRVESALVSVSKVAGRAGEPGEPGAPGRFQTLFAPAAWKRTLFYITTDAVVVFGASVLTHVAVLRHISSDLQYYTHGVLPFAATAVACQLAISFLVSSYRLKWSTFSLLDVPRVAFPSIATAIVLGGLAGVRVFAGLNPWSAVTWGLLSAGGVVAVRGSKRFYQEVVRRKSGKRAVLVMCSHKGYFLLDTLRRIQHFNYHLVGFIDPEPHNRGTVSQGLPVLGTFEEIEQELKGRFLLEEGVDIHKDIEECAQLLKKMGLISSVR